VVSAVVVGADTAAGAEALAEDVASEEAVTVTRSTADQTMTDWFPFRVAPSPWSRLQPVEDAWFLSRSSPGQFHENQWKPVETGTWRDWYQTLYSTFPADS
jgi:hypothetical protein